MRRLERKPNGDLVFRDSTNEGVQAYVILSHTRLANNNEEVSFLPGPDSITLPSRLWASRTLYESMLDEFEQTELENLRSWKIADENGMIYVGLAPRKFRASFTFRLWTAYNFEIDIANRVSNKSRIIA